MKELVAYIIYHKGAQLGASDAMLKLLQNIHEGNVVWRRVLTMIPATITMGYIGWELGTKADLSVLLVYILSLFMALNSFVVLAALQSKEILEKIGNLLVSKLK